MMGEPTAGWDSIFNVQIHNFPLPFSASNNTIQWKGQPYSYQQVIVTTDAFGPDVFKVWLSLKYGFDFLCGCMTQNHFQTASKQCGLFKAVNLTLSLLSGLSLPALLVTSRTNHVYLGQVLNTYAVSWLRGVFSLLSRLVWLSQLCRDPAVWWATMPPLLEVYYSSRL